MGGREGRAAGPGDEDPEIARSDPVSTRHRDADGAPGHARDLQPLEPDRRARRGDPGGAISDRRGPRLGQRIEGLDVGEGLGAGAGDANGDVARPRARREREGEPGPPAVLDRPATITCVWFTVVVGAAWVSQTSLSEGWKPAPCSVTWGPARE